MSSRGEEGLRTSSRRRTAAAATTTTTKRTEQEEASDTSSDKAPQRSDASSSRAAAAAAAPRNKKVSRKSSLSSTAAKEADEEEGCVVCKQDTDHANLMLCEACNGEYHIYCLNPPLEAVPEGDWFCAKCRPNDGRDNLDELVRVLPVDYTSRFNDVCWCQGGVGYGWWPACIFNPCVAMGAARTLAAKNLGKRHLVYFFDCNEAPFEVKADSAIVSWEMGLAMGYHMGRTAYGHGKRRFKQFQMALQSACIEEGVPKRSRLKWTFADEPDRNSKTPNEKEPATSRSSTNHSDENPGKPANRNLSKELEQAKQRSSGKRKRSSSQAASDTDTSSRGRPKTTTTTTPNRARSGSGSSATNAEPGGQLVCEIFRRMEEDQVDVPVGTVVLPSQKRATFADVRRYIKQELESLPVEWAWRFWVPGTGAISMRQESKCGSMLPFMWRTAPSRSEVGAGTQRDPVRVILVDAPIVSFDEFKS